MSTFQFFVGTHAPAGVSSVLKCEADFGNETFKTLYTMREISDPTYLAISKDHTLYALGKTSEGGSVYALKETDSALSVLNTETSGGDGPCHICSDPSGAFLLCANYSSGSIALYDLEEDGRIHSMCDFRQYSGIGYDSGDRQKGPHAHFAAFHKERDEVLVCDLGLDMVYVYELDRQEHKLRDTGRSIRLPDGSGPRHLAFSDSHPGMLYVLTEMANRIFVYQYSETERPDGQIQGQYNCVQTISAAPDLSDALAEISSEVASGTWDEAAPPDVSLMIPPTADNGSIGCAIRFSGDGGYLFVSSRLGYQSISAFRCDDSDRLHFCSRSLCGGITPRDFNVFEESGTPDDEGPLYCYILTANQDSDLVTALRFDRLREALELLEMKMRAVKPTCILPARQ
jgi:6-phosphogluconolactonase (cycloisomerase 2 family)